MDYLKNEIEKIKNGKSSFLGIDGGNIEAETWFCGIEFGGSLQEMSDYYEHKFVTSQEGKGYDVPFRTDCPSAFISSKYDLFLSEMVMNLFDVQNEDRSTYLKEKLYNIDSDIFKLNLYPLAKKSSGWDKDIEKEFEIDKEEYYGAYFDNRKIFFKELIKVFSPKTIICNAIKNSELQFVEAFFGDDAHLNYKKEVVAFVGENGNKKKFKIMSFSNDKISLIIIPFLGMGTGNLNSYLDVINMSKHLREHYLY